MSVHLVNSVVAPAVVDRAQGEFPAYTITLGAPDGNGKTPITISPDLAPAQVVVLQDWALEAITGIRGIKSVDVDAMADFLPLPAPTNNQRDAAIKAVIRTLRVMAQQ